MRGPRVSDTPLSTRLDLPWRDAAPQVPAQCLRTGLGGIPCAVFLGNVFRTMVSRRGDVGQAVGHSDGHARQTEAVSALW